MYQNIGNISVIDVVFDSNVATGSGGGLYQNSFAGELLFCQAAVHSSSVTGELESTATSSYTM